MHGRRGTGQKMAPRGVPGPIVCAGPQHPSGWCWRALRRAAGISSARCGQHPAPGTARWEAQSANGDMGVKVSAFEFLIVGLRVVDRIRRTGGTSAGRLRLNFVAMILGYRGGNRSDGRQRSRSKV